MLTLFFSADHELYLGQNLLPAEEGLLAPTRRLLEQCRGLGLPLTLFTDLLCWERLRALGQEETARAVEGQLQEALRLGHDVQAHLHPHWPQAVLEEGVWRFAPEAYLLTLDQAAPLLAHARTTLERLLRLVRPDYRCCAFRAGGYGLQPHAGAILTALAQTGYRLDSSLIPGYRTSAPTHQVDFSRLPNGGQGWWDGVHGLGCPAPEGVGVREVPIPGVTLTRGEARRLLWREALAQAWGVAWGRERCPRRGYPCFVAPAAPVGFRLKQAWWRFHGVLGQSHLRWELNAGVEVLMGCLELYLERHGGGDLWLALNMHPKGMDAWHFRTLERLYGAIRRRFGGEVRFVTFAQAAALLEREQEKEA